VSHTTGLPSRRWATLPELAEYLQISMVTARRLITRGTIPGYRFGNRIIRVDLNEVDDILGARPMPSVQTGVTRPC
jgi:excisionase family DNA binding protein